MHSVRYFCHFQSRDHLGNNKIFLVTYIANLESTNMENLVICCRRFPFVGKKILNNLENQSLARSKEINRRLNKFLENERFYWIRILMKYKRNFEEFEESWNHVIENAPIAILKQLALAVQEQKVRSNAFSHPFRGHSQTTLTDS